MQGITGFQIWSGNGSITEDEWGEEVKEQLYDRGMPKRQVERIHWIKGSLSKRFQLLGFSLRKFAQNPALYTGAGGKNMSLLMNMTT